MLRFFKLKESDINLRENEARAASFSGKDSNNRPNSFHTRLVLNREAAENPGTPPNCLTNIIQHIIKRTRQRTNHLFEYRFSLAMRLYHNRRRFLIVVHQS